MTVLDILGVWNLFMTRQFIPVYTLVYTAPCLKLPALASGVKTKVSSREQISPRLALHMV